MTPTALVLFSLAMALNYSFRSEEAFPLVQQAIRLNPFVPALYIQFGIACRETGRYEEGIAAFKKALQLAPNSLLANIILATLYSYAGREDEARAAAAEVLRIDPNFSLIRYAKEIPWKEGPKKRPHHGRPAPGGVEVRVEHEDAIFFRSIHRPSARLSLEACPFSPRQRRS